jgi:hypothetical protein
MIYIKKVYKINSFYEKGSQVFNAYPNLKLLAKILVDDGTNEAIAYLYDQAVVNLFKLEKKHLDNINDITKNTTTAIVYEKFTNVNILSKDCFENCLNHNYFIYCLPYSNVSKKKIYDNPYDKYFDNLTKHQNMKNKALNLVFINGDIVYEKVCNEDVILPRPCLKTIYIEPVE